MWKRVDELLSHSEKHAQLGFNALRVWLWTLPHTDCNGVFTADPRLVKAQCMPLLDVRLDQVEAALAELVSARLIHLFDAGSKRYLVFHDHDQWNPPGNLKFQRGKYPLAPESVCQCVVKAAPSKPVDPGSEEEGERRSNVVRTSPSSPLSSSNVISPRDEMLRQMFNLAKNQNVAARADTLMVHLKAWTARLGAQEVQARLMDKSVVGKTVNEIHDQWFPKVAQKALAPAPKSYRCGTCNDTGLVDDPRDGSKSECSCRRRRAEGA